MGPKLVDIFSGCGGLGLGFHQAGFETLLANELHEDPARTYVHNLLKGREDRMRIEDIRKIPRKFWRNLAQQEVDCVAGGPPCQGFSVAGRGMMTDPRNDLFMEFLKVVREIHPKTVVFENVPGFANRYGNHLRERLLGDLNSYGFLTAHGILEGRKFGVPQLRRRFFCIGVRSDLARADEVALPPATWDYSVAAKKLTAGKVLGDLDVYEEYGQGEIDGPVFYERGAHSSRTFQREMRSETGTRKGDGPTWNTKIPRHTERVVERMRRIQKGESRRSFTGTNLATKKLSQRALEEDAFPNITVVSLPDDYIHYNENLPRTLSVRECARLQTFPDHFRFIGKRTTGGLRRRVDVPQYTQVANAIPPRMAEAIGSHLRGYIDG